MGYGLAPDFQIWINDCWGTGNEGASGSIGLLSGASNIVVGSNPPYTATDFLNFYPGFGGKPLQVPGCTTTLGSPDISGFASTSMIAVGQLVAGPGIPGGAVVASIGTGTITLSQNATASGTVTLSVYVSLFAPLVVLNAYIALASACVIQGRWQETWALAMGLFIAHWATLYLRSDGDIYSSAGAKAAAGLQVGITVQKSAGPVSQGLQVPGGLDDWGAWTVTTYGQQFATLAKIHGGPMLVV